jgi:hypothetical protein
MKKKENMRARMVHENPNYKQKEVIQMKKREGLRSWMCTMLVAVAVTGMSLLLVQVAGAVSYTITVTQNTGGTISPGTSSVLANTDKAFTITPSTNYCIATLKVDGVLVQPARTYKFTKVIAIHSISATFAPDRDNDGISDDQELIGITLAGGAFIPGKNSGLPRDQRLDPDTKDLFVILAPAAPTKFPVNPLEFALKPQSQGGLGFITFHVIPETQTTGDRFLNSSTAQKAVRITESSDPGNPPGDSIVLGSSTCGTPDQDKGTVYTQRIENHVNSVYQAAGATPPPGMIDTYIKHTIAHELGHMVGPLAPVNNPNYGGNHYQSLPNDLLMNQFVYYVGTTFYIGTSYTSADQGGVKLK